MKRHVRRPVRRSFNEDGNFSVGGNPVILAILATSLLITQPMMAVDRPKPNIIDRAKQEYQAFKGALSCARKKGFKNCSSEQKKQIVGAGIAFVLIVTGIALGSYHLIRRRRGRQVGPAAPAGEVGRKEEELPGDIAGVEVKPVSPEQQRLLNERLMAGVILGDPQRIKKALTEGANVNALVGKNVYARFPLWHAVDKNNINLVLPLLDAGADVRAENRAGKTITEVMSMEGRDPAIIEALRAKGLPLKGVVGVPVESVAPEQQRLNERLMDGAILGDPQRIKKALAEGANVNALVGKHVDAWFPLWHAVYKNNINLVLPLLDAGADVRAENRAGKTITEVMSMEGRDPAIIEALRAKGLPLPKAE